MGCRYDEERSLPRNFLKEVPVEEGVATRNGPAEEVHDGDGRRVGGVYVVAVSVGPGGGQGGRNERPAGEGGQQQGPRQ